MAGLFFLELDRIADLLTNWLSALGFNYQLALTFNDPPSALAGLFIALGLREMYRVYIKNSKEKRRIPNHDEIWKTERN